MKNYVKEGKQMPYTPGADVESGRAVLVGTIVGITTGKILNGEEGELSTVGVFSIPNPDSVVIAQGALVGYDIAGHKVIAAGAGDFDMGTAHRASSGSDDLEVLLPLGPA